MKRTTKAVALVLALTGVAGGGCGVADKVTNSDKPQAEATTPPASDFTEQATKLVAGMTMEQKVGQLFVVRREAATDTALQSGKIGGVTFFSEDGDLEGSAADIAARADHLQKVAVANGSRLPLIVAIDQEYGSSVGRLTPAQATIFPGNMALGATQQPELAEAAGKAGGAELRALGFNVDFAPDGDVNYNPLNPIISVRAFSDDPDIAADMTARAVKGYQAGGVAATVKHFPGHGNTDTDSHTALPIINEAADVFKKNNLPPFTAAINAGADMVMVGHIKVPAIDPERPASLSRKITTDLLRGELGFKGVVITDSLEMEGANIGLSQSEIAINAFTAGADILLMPTDLEAAYNGVLSEVQKQGGRITPQALDEAVTRIVALKLKYGLKPGEAPTTDVAKLKSEEATKVCAEIGAKSVTLLSGGPSFGTDKSVFVTGYSNAAVETLHGQFPPGSKVTFLGMGKDEYTDAEIAEGVTKVGANDPNQVIVLLMASPKSHELAYLKALKATGRPVYVVLVRSPYAGAYTGAAQATLAAYSSTPCSMQAVTNILLGTQKPNGKLPVALPDGTGNIKYERGHPK